MHHLMTGMHSENCAIRLFCPCVNITKGTYINLDDKIYHTQSYMVYIAHGAMMNKQYETKLSTRENDAIERLRKHEIC